ncbi:LysR family transcriptional regulator [Sutterella sp.]|uniref:LysR family transcriptional regulator n=1 Tax=Sutterella sp. TaxID=1981025 RepID=UPI0026DF7644|nr:LysR family transcriptional regulator [Sutterella sp.]MDO5532714.1 LysR family transcriptional regulator [Sutterella sp.]
MLFRQLRYFSSVARFMSFSRAAEECCVSQSAVSQQVRALEEEFGVPLVEREGRGFRLTPAGEHLARRADGLLRDVSQLKREMKSFGEEPAALSLGYLSRYDGWEIRAAVAAFALRHPKAEISAAPGSHEALYDGVLSGRFDLLVSNRRRSLSPEFRNRRLFTSEDSIEVSEASPLARLDEVSVKELRGMPCILIAPEERAAEEAKYFRETLNFDCPFLFAASLDEARMLVAGNRGFLPVERRGRGGAAVPSAPGGVMRSIPLMDDAGRMRHDYYAFWLRARTTPFIEEFADILAELMGERQS